MREGLHEFLLRLKGLLNRKRMNREMAEELAFHQEMLRAKLEREGVGAQDMEAAVRRRFGNAERWQERLRELWQLRRVENFSRDVRFATRLLARTPGFTAVALLTLLLGVGANTTVFSMIDGLLLRPLAVPQSDRLAVLGIYQGSPKASYSFPEPLLRGLEKQHDVFSRVFAFFGTEMQLRGRNGLENVRVALVSGGYFEALQTAPLLGRTLSEQDDRKGGNPAGFAAVISDGFRQRWFGRTSDVVGKKLTINNVVFTIAGVMPERFRGADPLHRPDIYLPLATEPVLDGEFNITAAGYHAWWLTVMGRLAPGVSMQQASAAVGAATAGILREQVPDAGWVATQLKSHFRFEAESGSAGFTYVRLFFRKPLLAVFTMCGGILLLACLNLTSLLLARGAARERELATRLALGATRQRLTQQLLTESLLLATTGTVLGLGIAPFASRALGALLLSGQPDAHLDTSLDPRLLGFAALVAAGTTLLIGLLPALRATSRQLNEQIRSDQHTIRRREDHRWLPRVLMSVEVALALMLVIGAGLLASSLVRLYRSGEGFDPRGLFNLEFRLDRSGMDHAALMQFYQQMGEGLQHTPGVTQVSFARIVPLTGSQWDEDVSTPGQTGRDVYFNGVSPNYFQTMRIPLLEGRDFGWNDTAASEVILNEKAARLLFPQGNGVGKTVEKSTGPGSPPAPYQVVGVVADAKYQDLRSEAPPTAYLPMTQLSAKEASSFYAVVRTRGDAGSVASAARTLTRRLATSVPMPVMTSMARTIDDSLSAERMMALLSVFFAGCALLVTAIGLYGTLAYATARRTSEIGIRIALGARRGQVVGLICRQNALVALVGSGAGLLAAIVGSKLLASFLYGTGMRDPWVMLGSVAALATIAAAASLLPALRAARIDPMAAIRCE